jgi:hypothetical protein
MRRAKYGDWAATSCTELNAGSPSPAAVSADRPHRKPSGDWRRHAGSHGSVKMTRLPGSVPGACFAGSHSPRPLPLAPPAPRRIAPRCSPASQLLRQGLTSHVRASSATAPHLPDANLGATCPWAEREISRFPYKERPHMLGVSDHAGSSGHSRSRAPSVLPSVQ